MVKDGEQGKEKILIEFYRLDIRSGHVDDVVEKIARNINEL